MKTSNAAAATRTFRGDERRRRYRHWPIENMYKLASRMARRTCRRGEVAKRADAGEVVFVRSGGLKIFRRRATGVGAIEVALLGPDDVFGLVEMMGRNDTARWAVASQPCEVFVVPSAAARELSVADPRTNELAKKIVAARTHWEAVCEASYQKEHVAITPAMMQ